MSVIENVSMNLSRMLGKKLNKSNEEIAVLKYGMFVILHTVISVILTIAIGILTDTFLEICIISFCAASVKRYSGGIHATSPNRCLIIGISLSMVLAYLCKILISLLTKRILFILVILVCCFCYRVLYKKCPVPSKNKPMTKKDTRNKLRKSTFKLVNMYYILISILFIGYIKTDNQILEIILMSISLGIFMQSFALSNLGQKVIVKIDLILSKYGNI